MRLVAECSARRTWLEIAGYYMHSKALMEPIGLAMRFTWNMLKSIYLAVKYIHASYMARHIVSGTSVRTLGPARLAQGQPLQLQGQLPS